MAEIPEPIAYSLAGPEKGAPIPVVVCSVCGSIAANWEHHFQWHANLHPHGGAIAKKETAHRSGLFGSPLTPEPPERKWDRSPHGPSELCDCKPGEKFHCAAGKVRRGGGSLAVENSTAFRRRVDDWRFPVSR